MRRTKSYSRISLSLERKNLVWGRGIPKRETTSCVVASSGVDREELKGRWGGESSGAGEGVTEALDMSRPESVRFRSLLHPAAGLFPSLCPPLGQERSNKLFGWEKRMEEVGRDGRGPWGG